MFLTKLSPYSVTQKCQIGQCVSNGTELVIIDTPGLFDSDQTCTTPEVEITQLIQLPESRPHVCLITLSIARNRGKDMQNTNRIRDIFGENILRHAIVVFTGADFLHMSEITLAEFVEEWNVDGRKGETVLRKLISECGERFFLINNREMGGAKTRVVAELINQIKALAQANKNEPFITISSAGGSTTSGGGLGKNLYATGILKLEQPAIPKEHVPAEAQLISTSTEDVHESPEDDAFNHQELAVRQANTQVDELEQYKQKRTHGQSSVLLMTEPSCMTKMENDDQ